MFLLCSNLRDYQPPSVQPVQGEDRKCADIDARCIALDKAARDDVGVDQLRDRGLALVRNNSVITSPPRSSIHITTVLGNRKPPTIGSSISTCLPVRQAARRRSLCPYICGFHGTSAIDPT
jgi:hypothetical protein